MVTIQAKVISTAAKNSNSTTLTLNNASGATKYQVSYVTGCAAQKGSEDADPSVSLTFTVTDASNNTLSTVTKNVTINSSNDWTPSISNSIVLDNLTQADGLTLTITFNSVNTSYTYTCNMNGIVFIPYDVAKQNAVKISSTAATALTFDQASKSMKGEAAHNKSETYFNAATDGTSISYVLYSENEQNVVFAGEGAAASGTTACSLSIEVTDEKGNVTTTKTNSFDGNGWDSWLAYSSQVTLPAGFSTVVMTVACTDGKNGINFTAPTVTPAVTLNDTKTFTPSAFEKANVTLNRTFVANQWNSLCLPFAMTADQIKAAFGDAKVAAMNTSSTSENVSFTTVTATEANVPYLIFVSSAVSSATIEGVTISDAGAQTTGGDGVKFNGNYEANKSLEATDYFVYNNNIVKGSNNTMNAFRAYFTSTNSNAKLSLSIDGESVTAIDGIKVSESSNSQAFNLAGQKVSGSYKGIVVKNGKKVIY